MLRCKLNSAVQSIASINVEARYMEKRENRGVHFVKNIVRKLSQVGSGERGRGEKEAFVTE